MRPYRSLHRASLGGVLPLLIPLAYVLTVACSPELPYGHFRCDPHLTGPCPEGYYCQVRGTIAEYRCYPAGGGFCGDGDRSPEEVCDGSDLGGRTCQDYGRWHGVPTCTERCQIDASDCLGLTALSITTGHACAIDELGQAWCWGSDGEGFEEGRAIRYPTRTIGEHRFVSLATARASTCGLDTEGAAWCWGNDMYLGIGSIGYTTDVPIPVWGGHRFTQLRSDEVTYCGLDTEGQVWCWGDLWPVVGYVGVPEQVHFGQTFRSVQVSRAFFCALDAQDQAWCWGYNGFGQLGNGSTDDAATPSIVTGGHRFSSLALGSQFACGLDADGSVWCWGLRQGPEHREDLPVEHLVLTPRPEASTHRFTLLRAGGDLVCGVDEVGEIWCWYGQDPSPFRALTGVEIVDLVLEDKGALICGITADGDARCQGWNGAGLLRPEGGLFTPWEVSAPTAELAIGIDLSCGLDTSGAAWCWGSGPLGDGFEVSIPRPNAVRVATLPTDLRSISTGRSHTCALDGSGQTWCWGMGFEGQIGPHVYSFDPVLVPGAPALSRLALGGAHSCGLDSSGTAWCWGWNSYGQLGNGSLEDTPTPTRVSGGHEFSTIHAGKFATLVLTRAGRAYCFGTCPLSPDLFPALLFSSEREPVAAAVDMVFSHLAISSWAFCGLEASTGYAWCWGKGEYGALGSGDEVGSAALKRTLGDQVFLYIWGGEDHFCALDPEGRAYCWGANDLGQAGVGRDLGDRVLSPTPVATDVRFSSLSLGPETSCGVSMDGQKVYCWGDNTFGQAAFDATIYEPVPLVAPEDAP